MILATALLLVTSAFCRDIPNENDLKLSHAVNDLAFQFFRPNLGQPNLVFSPIGLWATLGMAYGLKHGQRERHFLGIDRHGMKDVFLIYHDYLNKIVAEGTDYTMLLAHGIIARESCSIKDSYQKVIQQYFRTSVMRADISSMEARDRFNQWVKKKTYGRIFEFLKEAEIDRQTEIYYFTASYFKGSWKREFQKSDGIVFYNRGDSAQAKPVTMMHLKSELPYSSTSQFQAVKIPYKGDNLDLLVILPSNFDTDAMSPVMFHQVLSSMARREVEVVLPQFEAELHLPHVLNISRADHRAKLVVDREGAESTPLWPAEPPAQRKIQLDRPFYFFVLDSRTNLILMAGYVVEL